MSDDLRITKEDDKRVLRETSEDIETCSVQ